MRHLLPVLALLVVPLTACSEDPAEVRADYCAAVKERQKELTEITSEGGPTALIEALGVYRDLRAQAPSDITDEWQQVIRSIERLDEALDDAGVDPATYDPKRPPAEVTEEQRRAIEQAADGVGSEDTQRALEGVNQHSLDVCKTPLAL
ncbi:MAG: hypothetical protein ACRDOM_04960 [Nocardioides sp.]